MSTCARCYEPLRDCQCPEPGSEADHYGRVWRHCEEGLTMTKASMARFMMFCLSNHVEIGDVYAFNPKYRGSQVLASIRIRPDQIEAFERDTGGKLRRPPRLVLN
ncbi:hypothetical protein [Paracoccus versutus]